MYRWLSGFLLGTVASLLVVACDGFRDAGPEPADRSPADVLRRGNGGDPGSLDPALAEDVHAFNVLLDLYEGLVILDADGKPVPGAATGWTVSPDAREYRFSLRRNGRWSNGEPLVAQHFVDALRHVVARGSRSPNAFLFDAIENYLPVRQGEMPASALGVRAPDDFSIVFRLNRPLVFFPAILAMPVALPRLAAVHGDSVAFRSPERFVGNGAYVLDEWIPGSHIRLRRNREFHGAAQVSIDAVEYFAVQDPATEYRLYRTGELDITATISPAAFAEVTTERPDETRISPAIAVYYLAFDLGEPPLDDTKLRKALSMAIDRRRLTAVLGRGEQAAFNLVPPEVSGHVAVEYPWKQLARQEREAAARHAYKSAGFAEDTPLQLKLTYDAGDVHEKVALAVSSMWQEVLGVDVSLEKLEWKMFLDTRNQRARWQVMRFAWFGDFDDASTFTDLFRTDSEQNLPGYRNDRLDETLRLIDAEPDPRARSELLSDAERIILEDYPIVPLYFYVNKHLVSPRVRGFQPNALDRHATRFLAFE